MIALVAVAGGVPIGAIAGAIGSSSDVGPGLASTSPHRNREGAGTALTAAKSFGWGGTTRGGIAGALENLCICVLVWSIYLTESRSRSFL